MKLIHKFPSGYLEVEFEDVLESLYDVGEFIEFEGRDYQIVEKRENRYILRG